MHSSVHLRTCTLSHGYFFSVRQATAKATCKPGPALCGTVQDHELVCQPWESGRLQSDVETLDESFDFPNGKNHSVTSLLVLN